MKSGAILGIILIILGIFAFAYQGITFTTRKKVADIGPIHATKDEKHTLPLTPVVGGLLLIGGVILVLSGSRSAH
jgi:uncharacterized membrane protein HdeD (DUF308 family)